MKKVLTLFPKNARGIWLACYLIYMLLVLLSAVWGFGFDSVLKAAGKMETKEIPLSDFMAVNLVQEGDLLRSQTADPQLIYRLGGYALNLRVKMEFDANPGELDLYYTEKAGEDFDKYRRIWAVRQADGSYLYTLPRKQIDILRLDPGSAENLGISIESITINEPAEISRYLDISLNGLFKLAVYPALAACAIQYGLIVYQEIKKKKEQRKGSFDNE